MLLGVHFPFPQIDLITFYTLQVVTVLANMSGIDTCCSEIVENHGIEALIQFLYEREPQYGSEAEMAACERLHQKSAIALTRLCKDQDTCQAVLDLQGDSFKFLFYFFLDPWLIIIVITYMWHVHYTTLI